jgi:hypothetical protein
MITRALLIAALLAFSALLPLSALAQIQVFVLNGTTLTAVGSSLTIGPAAPGDTIETQFRVQNAGSLEVPLVVSLSGNGAFAIQCIPAPDVPPHKESAFCVDFSPIASGAFSATLDVNGIEISLAGDALAGATLTLSGSQAPLTAGATIGFGSVAVGASQTQGFVLSNSANTSTAVMAVTVSGPGFSGPIGLSPPVSLGPGQSAQFQVAFTPQSGIPYRGILTVDGRVFNLTGQGLDPPLPAATIVLASTAGGSAQQNSIAIPLASASQVSGNGTLRMVFQSSVAGVSDDPAIQFLSGPLRVATVHIAVGATSATIGGQPSIAFQTGTTAGTIAFALTLENAAPQTASLTIPPAPIGLSTATAVRELGSLNVAFSGFDNTYTASQLAFTFYDLKGRALSQGEFNVNAGTEFQQYFSTSQAGGAFALLARFPVSGDTSQVGSVTAQITNSTGTTTAQQIPIGN